MKCIVVSNTHRKDVLDILSHFAAASVPEDYRERLICAHIDCAVEDTYYDFSPLEYEKCIDDEKILVRDYPDSEFYEMNFLDYLDT